MKNLFTFLSFLFLSISTFSQWTQAPNSPDGFIRNIVEYNDTVYLSHSSNGIFRSTDNLNSWENISNGLNSTQAKNVNEVLQYEGDLYAATVDGVYKSTNKGNDWIKKNNGITIGPGSIYPSINSVFNYNGTLFAGAYNGIYYSKDFAENWNQTNIHSMAAIPKNFVSHKGFLFAARETINPPAGYKSFDKGFHWIEIPYNTLTNIITFFSESNKLWAGTISGVWLSTDNGISWESRNDGLSPDPYSSSIIRVNDDLITALKFGGSGVYRSSNDGVNWEDYGEGLPFLNQIDKLINYNNKIIAVTSDGLWWRELEPVPVELVSFSAKVKNGNVILKWETASESNNKGFEIEKKNFEAGIQNSEWFKIGFVEGKGTSLKNNSYSFKNENVTTGKYIFRLKQIDFDGSYEYSNEIKIEVTNPEEFKLSQNYPNPFNPNTRIDFSLPQSSKVVLKIYNLLGEKVTTLTNKNYNAGNHHIDFNAEGINSGIYLYELNAISSNDEVYNSTKKMILLK